MEPLSATGIGVHVYRLLAFETYSKHGILDCAAKRCTGTSLSEDFDETAVCQKFEWLIVLWWQEAEER